MLGPGDQRGAALEDELILPSMLSLAGVASQLNSYRTRELSLERLDR